LALVIVDYIQLVVPTLNRRSSNRQEEVSSISRALKALAKELKVPVLVLSQLTRAPEREDREPRLADLRESGAIEQDADVVMFIHRPNFFKKSSEVTPEERGETELIIAKQRNGPTDMIRFVFQGSFTRFEQRAPDSWTEPWHFLPVTHNSVEPCQPSLKLRYCSHLARFSDSGAFLRPADQLLLHWGREFDGASPARRFGGRWDRSCWTLLTLAPRQRPPDGSLFY
jgi:hypothetical protein